MRSGGMLNCPLRIMSTDSMPTNIVGNWRNDWNPGISSIWRLISRWSCSIRLFRHFLCFFRLPVLSIASPAFIDNYYPGLTVVTNNLTKETQSCTCIAFSGQQETDGLTCCIHCPVQIFALTFDFLCRSHPFVIDAPLYVYVGETPYPARAKDATTQR